MNAELKEKLLLRMFRSIEYIDDFAAHFYSFIETGIAALAEFDALPVKPTTSPDYPKVNADVELWHLKVVPNFLFMKKNMVEAIAYARSGDFSVIRSAVGSLRGLSRDMDGIRESFMDFIDPQFKKRYFDEWRIIGVMGDNIYYTLSNYWRTGEIFNTNITGVIDEKELLKYLQPGEQP